MGLAVDVNKVFMDCLFKPEECPPKEEDMVKVEGVIQSFGFHKGRLAAHKEGIRGFLDQMPKAFHKNSGGGWSFLNMCETKDGELWGEHKNVQELVCLGVASGLAQYCTPREFWKSFPGGMPYITIDTEGV